MSTLGEVMAGIPDPPPKNETTWTASNNGEREFIKWAGRVATDAAEGNRNNTVFKIAAEACGRGLQKALALSLCREHGNGLSDAEVSRTVESAYSRERGANPPARTRLVQEQATAQDAPDVAICSARDLLDNPPETPPEIVKGIAYAGSKITLSSNSKGRKTWLQLHLAACIATGRPWLGHETAQGRVLYLNLELQPFSIAKRLAALESALKTRLDGLDLLNLRGRRMSVEMVCALVRQQVERGRYTLIVADPLYKLLGGRSENNSEDMAELLGVLEEMAFSVGSALLVAHHFSKGNQAAKNAIDRASGSGVVARDGDSLLVMTENEQDDCVTLECILRDFAPVPPKGLRWRFPLFEPDASVEAGRHKQPGGRPPKGTPEEAAKCITGAMAYKEAVAAIQEGCAVGVTRAKELLRAAKEKNLVGNYHGPYQRI